MSNKIALATIQFRADAKGANAALDSLRMSADNARRTMKEMQDALDRGVKTMKDSSGVEFNVADRLKSATREAKNFEAAIRELMKGATALEEVVKNISMGTIERSSRAELKGAINAAESRKRSVRGDDKESLEMQRELNIVIEESRKQLNNLDRDTQKVIDTLKNGGTVAESVLSKEQKGLQEILAMIPKGTEEWNKYSAQLKEIQTYVANIRQQEQVQATSLLSDKNLGKYSEEQIRAAIDAGRQLIQTYKTADPEAQTLADNIVRAETHLKDYGVEAARVAAKEAQQIKTQEEAEKQLQLTMNKRLRSLTTISTEALAESKKYWQTQVDGAEKGTAAFNKAANALKKIEGQERTRKFNGLNDILGNPSSYGISEVRQAVQEMERLRDSVAQGTPYWHKYNNALKQGKEYLDQLARTEAADRIAQQMANLNTLSVSGLQEIKKYWETMVAGAKRGSQELDDYKAKLKAVEEEEQIRTRIDSRRASSILTSGGDLGRYSENEIRAAIEAGNRLIKTYQTASPEAEILAMHIVRAEEHLKQYGIEAERTAAREAKAIDDANRKRQEANRLMEEQLSRGTGLTESALKAQEQYWQRLIDDPKAAADEIAYYIEQLNKVKAIQNEQSFAQTKVGGLEALRFFRGDTSNASADELRNQAAALKKYRDSLPREDNADVIAEINGYLLKTGQIAGDATVEMMSFGQAMDIAAKAGKDGFDATEDEIKSAIAALEKGIEDEKKFLEEYKKNIGNGTNTEEKYKAFQNDLKEYEKALRDLKIEQDNVGMSHKRMTEILDNPIKADNLNELRQAIKRAKQELNNMDGALDKNKKEYESMAAQVKKAEFQLKSMEAQAKGTASAFEKAWSRLKTYITLYVGAAAAMQKVMGTMGDLMELSDKMGEVRKTTNLTEEAVGELSRNLAKLDVRTPLTELMSISAAAGQLGLKTTEDIQGFTEAANKLMIALPEMGKEAATEMMRVAIATGEVDKIRKQLQEGTIEGSSATAVAMEKIASTIDRLRASSASTAPEITDFVKRLGAVGAQSGISIDQVAALGSTISSLGMRVEMSATALSRMIPAIKNNAFAIANAIGVAPEALRSLFEAGRGMEAILMIFQHLKEQNANADTIESLLGIGNMKDVMKQLNQQGARAGIVFAGLSQNVDELRKQLVTANQAYEENIAIQQEFDRMNDTTAAKWERLKNRLEEMFVGDASQSFLGGIISLLDDLVKLIADTGPIATGIKTLTVTWTALKLGIGEGIKAMALWFWNLSANMDKAATSLKAFGAANWIGALVTAVTYLAFRFYEWSKSMNVAASEMAKLDAEITKQTEKVDGLFRSLAKTNEELSRAKTKQEEVTKADKDATEAESALKKVSAEHAATIRDINSKYGTYLGYMLSETSSAQQLAAARDLINKKLRETITLKQQEAALGSVEQEYGGKVNKKAASVEQIIQTFYGDNYDTAARVSTAVSEAAQKYAKNSKEYQKAVKKILADNKIQADVAESYMGTFEDYRKSIEDYQKQEETVNRRFKARTNINRKQTREAIAKDLNSILGDWRDLVDQYRKAEGEEKEKLAAEVYKQQRAYANALANNTEYFEGDNRKAVYDKNIKNMQTYEKGLRSVAGEAIRTIDAMERAEGKITGLDLSNDGESGNNPWGGGHEGASTDWKNMTANQLVERRKQMNEFVKAIQTDTDVQSVLKEDAALKKAIENGMSADMRTVIEWYNTERLKIQDELDARHLTNTGDWKDPKQERGRKKRLQDDMKAYLEELDAYYTERKTRIEEARNDEEISEAEAWNRNIKNEAEWHRRRAELQIMYSNKHKQVVEDEQDAIAAIIAERTGDSEKFIKATISQTRSFSEAIKKTNAQGAKEYRKFQGDLDLGSEKDWNKVEKALGQHLKVIEDIINKERPFNGIAKNMRDNLGKMGILTADLAEGADSAAEELKRITFLLGEAENAYMMTVEKLLDDMRQHGFKEWADVISKDSSMQQGMLAMLRQTFDAVQDAIKKESSIIKKQVEIMMQDITEQVQADTTRLQMLQNSVSRANSLIGAGPASERVADKLAIKQIQLQITMQETRIRMLKKAGADRVALLNQEADLLNKQNKKEEARQKRMDAENVDKSVGLTLTKEQVDLDKQRVELAEKLEESQNRLYTSLREWSDLLTSGLQSVMEASHAGDAEYYNERAKMNLTGKGGPGAGTYIIIDNEGTEDAVAHYEYLDERQALERQHEIERENAQAEAWEKLWDDLNMKMSDQITDWINASMQNASIDANTDATRLNTDALGTLTEKLSEGITVNTDSGMPLTDLSAVKEQVYGSSEGGVMEGQADQLQDLSDFKNDWYTSDAYAKMAADDAYTEHAVENSKKRASATSSETKSETSSTQSSFAKMAAAANMYGLAYQTMSNDNLDAFQKFQMFALQAAGQTAIAMLTTDMAKTEADGSVKLPGILGEAASQLGPIAGPIAFAAMTALLGGLMAMAMSKVGKAKSTISQVTGASVSAGRLSTGMMTYAEGNVNEFTDPRSLTPGRSYNVDAADGRTYRARYMGKDAKTHITNGPEFHLVGEKGREAIIDAHTTRDIRMNEPEIWRTIQTLSGGGRIRRSASRMGRGVPAFADGNLEDFEALDSNDMNTGATGFDPEAMAAFQSSLDRNNELLDRALTEGIHARFDVYGKGGLIDSYDTGKKTVKSHGERY